MNFNLIFQKYLRIKGLTRFKAGMYNRKQFKCFWSKSKPVSKIHDGKLRKYALSE